MNICRKQLETVHRCILILLDFVGTLELALVTLATQHSHTTRAIKVETCFRARRHRIAYLLTPPQTSRPAHST